MFSAQPVSVILVLFAALFATAPGSAQSLLGEQYVETKSTTIGPSGELFHIQAGMHLDLFPEDPAAGWNSILALDVMRNGQLAERLVIPGTEGFEVESDASLLADGDQLFILWMSRAENELSNLELISFDSASSTWSQPVDVSGNPLPLKGPPTLAVTRETLSLPALVNAAGEETAPAIDTTRTVVHVLWWEEAENQEISVFYTPIVLTDGEFLGWNPLVRLDPEFFDLEEIATATNSFSNQLLRAPSLDRGTDERSVVIGLPIGATGELLNMVVRLLPDGLAAAAEDARSHIVGVGLIQQGEGSGGGTGPDYEAIAEDARSHIVGIGRGGGGRLHLGVREYLGSQVAERILAFGAQAGNSPDPEELANVVWEEVMDAGASLLGNQLRSEDLPCGVLHLGQFGMATPGAEATESVHQVEFCISSEYALPETSSTPDAEHRIITSEDGTRSLIVWQDDDGTVRYRRTKDEGWTETRAVPDSSLGLNDSVALLRSQVRVR